MKLRIENVYNTQDLNKDIPTLEKLAKKHIKKIVDEIIRIDENKTVEHISSFSRVVDWEYANRGKDFRFEITIRKTGRNGITARKIYELANTICENPCYFSN